MTYAYIGSTYELHDYKPTIVIYGRDVETYELKRFNIDGFKPYFYVDAATSKIKNCWGEPVRKVVCENPLQVPERRKEFERTFDADIPFDMRFLIDKDIYYGFDEELNPVETDTIEPRICFFDIEVDVNVDDFPTPESALYPICVISCMDSYTKEKRIFTLGGRQVNDEQVICSSETKLLESFISYINEFNFDVITGWYSSGFDIPYIVNRARKLKVSLINLNRTKKFIFDVENVSCRYFIDMMTMFMDWSKPLGRQPSYSLKSIVKDQRFGGFEYEDYGAKIHNLIENDDWETVVEYASNDVVALDLINTTCGLFKYYANICRLTGIKLSDVFKKTRIIEYYILHKFKIPLPTRKKKEHVDYEGGFVYLPDVGIHNWVATFDLAALYPSIIVGFNVSPDVYNMIPKTIIGLMDEREKLRSMRMENQDDLVLATTEQSLKYIINSFYGVLGYSGFKLYDPKLAAFVPRKGREMINALISFAESEGYKVHYGDTDSIQVSPIKNGEEGEKLEKKLNNFLKIWGLKRNIKLEHAPKIKMEKIYKNIMFKLKKGTNVAAKKRYIGRVVWKDGHVTDELDYKGFELRRSDVADITKEVMLSFFEKLFYKENETEALEYLKDTYRKVLNGEHDIFKCTIPKKLHADNKSPHKRGISYAKILFNLSFGGDETPRLLYLRRPVKELCITTEEQIDIIKDSCTIDWITIADKTIAQKMQTVVESLGYNWDIIMKDQYTLGDFI